MPKSLIMALDPGKSISQYKSDIWRAERGLAQASIIVIRQTGDGYIWLGTIKGLVCFDGVRFKLFDKDNTPQLNANGVKALYEDTDGRLWIGAAEGGLVRYKDGEFKNYSTLTQKPLKDITSIIRDKEGTMWIGTLDSGLTRLSVSPDTGFNSQPGHWATYTVKHGLTSNRIRHLLETPGGELLIATPKGLNIKKKDGSFTKETVDIPSFDKYMICLCMTSNGDLWIGAHDGLYRIRDKTVTRYGREAGLPNLIIKCLHQDKEQNLWAGTDGGGLVRVRNGRMEKFSTHQGLAGNYINALLVDRDGSLWMGTNAGGLHRLKDTPFTTYTVLDGLSDNMVSGLCEDSDGSIWIGTETNGLNRLFQGKFIPLTAKNFALVGERVNRLALDNDGKLWISGEKGLNLLSNGKMRRFTKENGLSQNNVENLFIDRKGALWIVKNNSLDRYYKGTFAPYDIQVDKKPGKKGGIASKWVRCIHEDRNRVLWFGTYGNGLYSVKKREIKRYTTKNGLVHNHIETFYEDKQGVLYIGTRGGFSRLRNGKFTNYTTSDGLSDSYILNILEDNFGYLWMGTRIGILRINKKQLSDFAMGKIQTIQPTLFDEADGMKSSGCNRWAIKSRDGKLWFSTLGGVVMVDPSNIPPGTPPGGVLMEEVIADGHRIPFRNQKEPVSLAPGTRRLEFRYTSPTFVKPDQITFKLKLDGYDPHWLEVGKKRFTLYTGLTPGHYTFRVKAGRNGTIWNKEAQTFSFIMRPYFYQTTWFYVSVVLFLLGASFSFYRFRIRRLKKREKELSAQVRSRTRQLADQSEQLKEMDKVKSRFFANISHEFRTPLTLIMGPLEERLSHCTDDKKQQQEFKMMLRNSRRLLNLVNQLLDLSRFDSGKMELQATARDIVSFFKGIVNAFDSLVLQNGLTLSVYAPDHEIILLYDAEKLEHAILNLMINAIKYTPGGGEISASLKRVNSQPGHRAQPGHRVEICVRDTGIGIAPGQLDHIFERFYQAEGPDQPENKGSGIGLALTKEIVKLHNGEIAVHSELGKGSEFIISLPGPGVRADNKAAVQSDVTPSVSTGVREMLDTIAPPEEEDEEPSKNPDSDAGKNIILLVEDNADVRAYIRGPLRPLYRVEEAVNGSEGIQKAREIIPDLIISDIMMPGTDGYELCKVLKDDVRTSHIPIILLTAKASEQSIIEGFETRADDYVTKPFNTKILIARIDSLIDTRRRLQERYKREIIREPAEIQVSSLDREFMKDLQKAVEANLGDPEFTINRLAELLYMSRATLNRKIRALTGESANRYIQVYRLKRGAQLLKGNFGNVTQVAFEVGFSSSPYFSKCFREIFHQSPQSYQAAASHEPGVRADV